ncbi:uncharacterized protein C6orf47 homolog [Clupea harengus]|uniref:Uncharacterized protein C6orf47 homolog n=1 Tax=Clupea harengus TaxID=7950 RepID=A0A8M1KKL7_CLUHA|nr:uncharacterized protein C6orf47 homolog [Clupea harengus]XP_042562907.1 uncharacterized protein C6orf47 homolog [Clupea harengus]XP_042562908.1 uncharacterized protein C6orf47 homolog [Clupea harengus]XP_042562909.1 uncharacterized protein C6orf47 homolog [Clupea harengus]XP_042562910.1 uncharacterized protein C6orf47 homolog [Clupea harengus]XP_042562911.1 uncharacterized protein C6orf47 homolog [Clupea harengus]XP_042562912.1 uncharacterized protein C6orf47 homolog [Clupea harengus]XP_0
MTSVTQRVWGWVRPTLSYRPWGGKASPDGCVMDDSSQRTSWGWGGVASWVWGAPKEKTYHKTLIEEYWEAPEERVQHSEVEDLRAGTLECDSSPPMKSASRWWHTMMPSSYLPWPRFAFSSGLRQRKVAGWGEGLWDKEKADGDISDYDTPPPSPTAFQKASTFSVFSRSWEGEVLPEHFLICFNFLRHLFDLCVVGLLWAASLPARMLLDVVGVQGALKLWLHGMAMFFVSTVGMATLLWVVQEFLPQFALVYGIIQGIAISVSVRQSIITGEEEQMEVQREQQEEVEERSEEKQEVETGVQKLSMEESSRKKILT